METFTLVDLAGLVAVSWVFVKVLGPVAVALGRRIEGRGAAAGDSGLAAAQFRDELEQLHERVDFLERALTTRPPSPELPRERTPV